MSKNLSLGLLVAGIIIVVLGLVVHFALKVTVVPHFSVIVGIIGAIVAAIGVWGFVSGRQNA